MSRPNATTYTNIGIIRRMAERAAAKGHDRKIAIRMGSPWPGGYTMKRVPVFRGDDPRVWVRIDGDMLPLKSARTIEFTDWTAVEFHVA